MEIGYDAGPNRERLMRVMRKNLGVVMMALSVIYSVVDLLGWLRPPLLRLRIHGGSERLAAIVLGSLSLKAAILIVGILLAFWPDGSSSSSSA
jgi:hypothetical protein